MAPARTAELRLNRDLQNNAFNSWKLGPPMLQHACSLQLPAPVKLGDADATSYIHNRVAALRNHLISVNGEYYVFLEEGEGGAALQRVDWAAAAAGGAGQLHRIAGADQLWNATAVAVAHCYAAASHGAGNWHNCAEICNDRTSVRAACILCQIPRKSSTH